MTNRFGQSLTNLGRPLTNAFGRPLTNANGVPVGQRMTNRFGAPVVGRPTNTAPPEIRRAILTNSAGRSVTNESETPLIDSFGRPLNRYGAPIITNAPTLGAPPIAPKPKTN